SLFVSVPFPQSYSYSNTPNFRHFHIKGFSSNCHRYIYTACSHCKHTHTTISTSMTIGTKHCFARLCHALHMHWMPHIVTRTTVIKTEFPSCTFQKQMIIRVFKIGRASCRERGWRSVVGESVLKK